MLKQVLQEQELLGGQADRAPAVGDEVALPVEFDGPVRQHGVPRLGPSLRAAEQGPDARHQLARAERLGDVVVGPQLEADDAVRLLGAGREHDDGQRAGLGGAAQRAADLEAVDAGQHEIEDHQVRHARPDRLERLAAVAEGVGHVPRPRQVALEQFGDVSVVFDNQDVAHGVAERS